MAIPILQVENLSAFIPFNSGPRRCFGKISLEVREGECLGIIGERDSGKSCLLLAMLGLFEKVMLFRLASMQKLQIMSCRIPPPTEIPPADRWIGSVSGTSYYNNETNLIGLDDSAYPREIAYIPEFNSRKNISFLFGSDIDAGEPLRGDGSEFHNRLIEALGLRYLVESAEDHHIDPRLLKPNESRKIKLLESLAMKPKLLLFDEPLDTFELTELRQVINALQIARDEFGMTLIIATQDAGILSELADRIAVLYTGWIVESGNTEKMLFGATHPYTNGLMGSNPTIAMEQMRRGKRRKLRGIPGTLPDPRELPDGCTFHPRCQKATEECKSVRPEYKEVESDHWIACLNNDA